MEEEGVLPAALSARYRVLAPTGEQERHQPALKFIVSS
jgi:hypothetical protein